MSKLQQFCLHWYDALCNLLFPRTCRVCDALLPDGPVKHELGEWLCKACAATVTKVEPPYCQRCGECYDGAMVGPFKCDNCGDRKFQFDFAIAGYQADGAALELIHAFKYQSKLSLRQCLGQMAGAALQEPRLLAENLAEWTLVPVPLHPSRKREREFNQSEEICRQLSKQFAIPMMQILLRVRPTQKQASLSRSRRLENLKSAFRVRRRHRDKRGPLAGRKLILVDDVFTTGATAEACAFLLKRQVGAEKVVVISIARG